MKDNSIQNIYDNPEFFENYKKLRRNDQGFNALIEQPAIRSLLPELKEKSILDIGCGFGDFCRYAEQQGVSYILGIDPSQNMINDAKELTSSKKIVYEQVSVETVKLENNHFDIIVSSVAFHYVEDYIMLIKKIANWLKPNGYLVFSVEHPICTANPEALLIKDEKDRELHPIYNYRDEKAFTQKWFVEGVKKYHRTFSTYINTLIENGFIIEKILEPMPSDQLIEQRKDFAVHKIRPPLLMIRVHLVNK